jgi:hypothetical protein
MSAISDLSRFVVLLSFAGIGYLLLAGEDSVGEQGVAIGTLAVGILAVVLIAYRFREDYERETGDSPDDARKIAESPDDARNVDESPDDAR